MRFIHVADIHASRDRLPQTLRILSVLRDRACRGDIDLIIFAGDFWDSTITATKGSGFSDIIAAVRELERHSPLMFIYGTPTHEPSGSLDAFMSERTTVLPEMAVRYFMSASGITEVIAVPEPRRSAYVADSVRETDIAINKAVSEFLCGVHGRDDVSARIVAYHGEVKGAVYQNGIYASSPTAAPKELLQSVHADYYALGHIHMPQEVFPGAWYPGSACPKDFGETHDGCYNIVDVSGGLTKVERVPFGLPTFVTVSAEAGSLADFGGDFSGRNVRVRFRCTKEVRKSLSLRQVADGIRERTNAVSVRLEPETVSEEAVARSSVVSRRSVVEKMTEYAREMSLNVPARAEGLLREIQDGTLVRMSYPQHSFELLSLSLRGAVGIRDGQHKEDFEIDFGRYDDGVVCMQGKTGRGKTTLLENCHPYPCMLTRDGPLKDSFFLKDSHRILKYRDENGLYYRISMLIDGKTKSGKAAYFAETSKDGESWSAVPDTDGSLASYQRWVDSTFGSIDVFLRTAFFAKEQTKGTPDISATTKGERMELLSKLAGTEHLKQVSVIARERRKETEAAADIAEAEIESYSKYGKIVRDNEQDIISWKNELKGTVSAVAMSERKVSELRKKDAEFQKSRATREANAALYGQYGKELGECEARYAMLDECCRNKDIYDMVCECRETAGKNALAIRSMSELLDTRERELADVMEEVSKLDGVLAKYAVDEARLASEERLLIGQMPDIGDVCPTCGSPLTGHKKAELEAHVSDVSRRLDAVIKERNRNKGFIDTARRQLKEKDTVGDLKSEVAGIKAKLSALADERDRCEAYISQSGKEYTERAYGEACDERERLSGMISDLRSKMENLAGFGDTDDVGSELEEAESCLRRERTHMDELSAMIRSAERENERYRAEIAKAGRMKSELNALRETAVAYQFIEDAFSNNGIPAIELRESAPEIAGITNRILSESYGNKFEVRFGSTSELKSGRKANEDFNIIVYDSENGDEKTIDLVSSGERIWIKQALFYAFSIVQMNRTGFNFRTRLIDESDGSLDGTLRPKYLQMVKSAHKAADARLTVLITHSQEIKDIAQQVIEI